MAAIPWFSGLGHEGEDLALARRELVERGVVRGRRAACRDFGVDRRAAGRHPPDGIGNLLDSADAILQEVPDTGRIGADELEGIARLDVLGEDEDGDDGVLAADAPRRFEALGLCVGGIRTSTIATSGSWRATRSSSRRVAGLADHLEARCRSRARASRKRTASSARTMRIGSGPTSLTTAESTRGRWSPVQRARHGQLAAQCRNAVIQALQAGALA